MMCGEIVERGPFLAAQLQKVRGTARRTEHDARAATLEQQVRDDRRAMCHTAHACWIRAERRQRCRDSFALVRRRGEHLSRLDRALRAYRGQVGIGPADVDADGVRHMASLRWAPVARHRAKASAAWTGRASANRGRFSWANAGTRRRRTVVTEHAAARTLSERAARTSRTDADPRSASGKSTASASDAGVASNTFTLWPM